MPPRRWLSDVDVTLYHSPRPGGLNDCVRNPWSSHGGAPKTWLRMSRWAPFQSFMPDYQRLVPPVDLVWIDQEVKDHMLISTAIDEGHRHGTACRLLFVQRDDAHTTASLLPIEPHSQALRTSDPHRLDPAYPGSLVTCGLSCLYLRVLETCMTGPKSGGEIHSCEVSPDIEAR